MWIIKKLNKHLDEITLTSPEKIRTIEEQAEFDYWDQDNWGDEIKFYRAKYRDEYRKKLAREPPKLLESERLIPNFFDENVIVKKRTRKKKPL
jgi:hypothetical protein